MIQHHLIYHFTSLEDGNTYYEANPQAAYYLVRSGKILQLVESRLGEYASRMMEAILYLGHASVSELEVRPELRSRKPLATNGIKLEEEEPQENGMDVDEEPATSNGDHGVDDKPAPFHATLKALASHGYILRVRDAHFQSPSDNLLEAQRAVAARSDIKALKGKKQEEAIKEKAQELVHERTNGDLTQGLMYNGLPRGIKRKFGNSLANRQSPNRQNGANGDHAEDEEQQEEEENEWSEDEDGFDNIPMEVRISSSVVSTWQIRS